ncbi:hypothetical protein [Streptomyces sp. NPDC002550]
MAFNHVEAVEGPASPGFPAAGGLLEKVPFSLAFQVTVFTRLSAWPYRAPKSSRPSPSKSPVTVFLGSRQKWLTWPFQASSRLPKVPSMVVGLKLMTASWPSA